MHKLAFYYSLYCISVNVFIFPVHFAIQIQIEPEIMPQSVSQSVPFVSFLHKQQWEYIFITTNSETAVTKTQV